MGATCNRKGKIVTNRHLSGDGIFIISSECADTEQLRSPASGVVVHQLGNTRIWTQDSQVGSANAKKWIDKMLFLPVPIRANVLAPIDAINRQIRDKINLSISVPMMWCCKKQTFSLWKCSPRMSKKYVQGWGLYNKHATEQTPGGCRWNSWTP